MNLENRVRARMGLPLRLNPDIRHDFPTSAVMIIRRYVDRESWGDPQPDLLAVARTGNFVGLPGGSVEWFETPREAAIREALEETGITVPLHAVADLGCWLDGSAKRQPTFAFYCTLPVGERPIAAGLLQVSVPEQMLLVVGGQSPREPELLHAMVYQMRQRTLAPVHDPHPSRAGILDMQYAGVLIPVYAIRS